MEHFKLRPIVCGLLPEDSHTESLTMGMAPGGLMRQKIEKDPYGLDAWDQENGLRLFIHLANSEQYKEITGNTLPHKPVTATEYTDAGLPWYEHYSESSKVAGAEKLSKLDSLAASSIKSCLLYTSPSPRDQRGSRMPSSA